MKPTGYRVRSTKTGAYYCACRLRYSSGLNGECGKIYTTIKRAYDNGIKWRAGLNEETKTHPDWEIVEFFSERADGKVVNYD